jgi:hypothetical protein
MKRLNLVGNKYGRLTVLGFAYVKQGNACWYCRCECGNEIIALGCNLRSGNTTSCSCYNKEIANKSRRLDLVGQRFGRLMVISRCKHESRLGKFICKCDCGNIVHVSIDHLRAGHTKSCGCYNKEVASARVKSNLIGIRFNRLLVIAEHGKNKYGMIRWLCLCDCGSEVVVATNNLTGGHTGSCGCYMRDRASEANSGANGPHWKGGISCNPYCAVWRDEEYKTDIKIRDGNTCQNPNCTKTHNKLVVHHIDYNKMDCSPGNLITLCVSCNIKANTNRLAWKDFYKSVLNSREIKNVNHN